MRKIEMYCYKPEMLAAFQRSEDGHRYIELNKAVGYLSMWNTHTFDRVSIGFNFGRQEDDLEVLAHYSCEGDRDKRFTMAGIWRPESNEFSFHS